MFSDKVWMLWLISKLTKTAFLSQFVRALHCQLNNRPFTLVGSNSEYRRHVAPAGTNTPPPRCSPLGSIFFNIYINYLWTTQGYKNMAESIYVIYMEVTICSGSLKSTTRKPNNYLKMLEPWFKSRRIKIAVNKCSPQGRPKCPCRPKRRWFSPSVTHRQLCAL